LSTVKRRSLRTAPLHSSLTRPILLGGAERDLVIIEVSVIAALLFGVGFRFASLSLALLIGTVGHRILVWIGRQDPQATRVFARHRLYQPFYPATAAVGAPACRVPAFREDTR
jgi:type IV secretion system protein VirB3